MCICWAYSISVDVCGPWSGMSTCVAWVDGNVEASIAFVVVTAGGDVLVARAAVCIGVGRAAICCVTVIGEGRVDCAAAMVGSVVGDEAATCGANLSVEG